MDTEWALIDTEWALMFLIFGLMMALPWGGYWLYCRLCDGYSWFYQARRDWQLTRELRRLRRPNYRRLHR